MSEPAESTPLKRYVPTGARYDREQLDRLLVASDAKFEGEKGQVDNGAIDKGVVKHVIDEASEHITDAKSVFEILPDTKLAMDILTSSIMSPNDLIGNELIFRTGVGEQNDEVVGRLTEVVEDYFTKKIKLVDMCVPALEDMLFHTGSYPIVCIPHSSIDTVINGGSVSVESIQEHFNPDTMAIKNVGFLAHPKRSDSKEDKPAWGLETHADTLVANEGAIEVVGDGLVTLADNPFLLKKPQLLERIQNDRKEALLDLVGVKQARISLESNGEGEKEKLISIYKKRKFNKTPIMELIANDDLGEEEPIWFKPPSESVIPVNVPGNVAEKVGFFIALDDNGNPISAANSKRHWDRLKMYRNTDEQATEIQRIREALYGETQDKDVKTLEQLHRAYTVRVESKIRESLQQGIHGENAEVELPDDVAIMMMTRAFKRQKTQLLYVPKELVTYMAFDYNEVGIGRSLLENTKILSSMRAMLLLANNQASMRNSQPGTRLDIELDPKDKDPAGTIERILTLREQANHGRYPLGNLDLTDIANTVNRNNVEVSVSNHPNFPQTKVTSEDINRSVGKVDTDMEESLRRRQLQGWGLTPELLDASAETDFAANIIISNKLMVKRIAVYQAKFVTMLTETVKMFIARSPYLMEQFAVILKDIKGVKKDEDKDGNGIPDAEEILTNFLESIEVALPAPDSSKIDTQIEEFDKYNQFVEEALNAYFSELMVDGMVDSDLADALPAIREAIKGNILRAYLRNNNILPEIEDLMLSEDLSEALKGHTDSMMDLLKEAAKFMHKTLKEGRKFDNKEDENITKEEEALNEEEEDENGGSEFGSDTSGDDETGGPDDNLDDNLGDDVDAGSDSTGEDEDPTDQTSLDEENVDNTDTGETGGNPEEDLGF